MRKIVLPLLLCATSSQAFNLWDYVPSWPFNNSGQEPARIPGIITGGPAASIASIRQFFKIIDQQIKNFTPEEKAQARTEFLKIVAQELETSDGADGSWRHLAWKLCYDDGIFKVLFDLNDRDKVITILNTRPVVREWWDYRCGIRDIEQRVRQLLGESAKAEDVKALKDFIDCVQNNLQPKTLTFGKAVMPPPLPVKIANRIKQSLGDHLQKPVTLATVGLISTMILFLRTFNAMRLVEDKVLNKEGWMFWKNKVPLRELQKQPIDDLLTELLADAVRRYDVFDSLDDHESSLQLFLQELEREIQMLQRYCTRARRLSWFKLEGVFGATPALLGRMEQCLHRLHFLRDLVLDHVVGSKYERNIA